ncbi:MAG TPA: S8 family serine peptidase [Vicinamibacterales bacterium]|nr:S8 family serine peptidase [Vicinamibacterales bacterium]
MRRETIEHLFYGRPEQQRRFTQDFPVLPDVWIEYGKDPKARIEVLLTPHNESDAPTVARVLRERLAAEANATGSTGGHVLYNESVVMAALTFPQLLRCALPLTAWWQRAVAPAHATWTRPALELLAQRLAEFRPGAPVITTDPRLILKLIRIVGAIELERQGAQPQDVKLDGAPSPSEVAAFASLFDQLPEPGDDSGILWSISLNRRASTSVWRSRLTVKADAAARLFEAKSAGIRWAVLDTGIDATHPAFARRDAAGTRTTAARRGPAQQVDELNSRIIRTFDFLCIKELLNPDAELPAAGNATPGSAEDAALAEQRVQLRNSLRRGRSIDWDLLEPFLRVPHTRAGYVKPQHDAHGTHVAGILAANWPEAADTTPMREPILGVCPDLELYDLRVLPDNPDDQADEFTVIAALQFVRHMNAHKDLMVVHGVNLSLSVPHDVANYACGRTPVCEECERVVAAGVVVVTAAGNRGFNKSAEATDGAVGDYRYISITDPGNADAVITVGSTHRMMPHNYGVSYFSSRGPTGDGRTKPDLVAPGERIESCSLNGYVETMDGTSMAAPHVSGAAALVMSRHRELIGQPRRIKEILCKTATDLGRERRFQGAGMVDVLRALQSV